MKRIALVLGLLLATMLACNFSASTANIAEATMAHDPDGEEPTSSFEQDQPFYAVVELANAPDDTNLKAVWTAVDAEGTEANQTIDEVEITSGSGTIHFDLTNDGLWPVGQYKVDLLLNDELAQTLLFEVEGTVAAEAAEPTAAPSPDPTASPTSPPTAAPTAAASTGDTLASQATPTPTSSPTPAAPEPLEFQAEPYVHPSGAFSFAVPQTWEQTAEDELSAAFGDNLSRVGAIFVNSGLTLDDEAMLTFIAETQDVIIGTFTDEYEVVAENDGLAENDLYYMGVAFADGDGQADLFFERRGSLIFILYFTSLNYEQMEPTWDAIIDSYEIDPEAAEIAAPASEPTPPPTPPTATPAPAANPFAPPPGVARVYLQNNYGNEYNIDFGDGSGSIQVMPGAQNLYHDLPPGKYNPGLSLPGGGATNVEFEIAPNQAWLIVVTEDLGVRWGQVYP